MSVADTVGWAVKICKRMFFTPRFYVGHTSTRPRDVAGIVPPGKYDVVSPAAELRPGQRPTVSFRRCHQNSPTHQPLTFSMLNKQNFIDIHTHTFGLLKKIKLGR